MKLSAAIRAGAVGRTQSFHSFYEPETGAVCPLGAAVLELRPDTPTELFNRAAVEITDAAMDEAPFDVEDHWQDCPAAPGLCIGSDDSYLDAVIAHLNDWHHWTFEQIAAWLESLGL